VHEPRLINLLIIGHDGIAYPSTEIVLQDGDPIPTTEQAPRGYAEWVPYQKGQAAKTEALQAQVNATTQGPAQPPEHLRHPRRPRQAEDCHPDPAAVMPSPVAGGKRCATTQGQTPSQSELCKIWIR
jgi:hypothetical protein